MESIAGSEDISDAGTESASFSAAVVSVGAVDAGVVFSSIEASSSILACTFFARATPSFVIGLSSPEAFAIASLT